MSKVINKAAVLGAGVMGSGIAALLAGTGIQVSLLDIIPTQGPDEGERKKGLTEESTGFRNRLAEAGLKKIADPRSAMLFSPDKLSNIRTGNLADNLSYLEEADWIIEVVVERLDIKKYTMKLVCDHCKADAIISSNTSGVSITKIAEDLPGEFKARFLGTHFFNPPRWTGLFEIIPTKWTSESIVSRMADFGANALGKTVVLAKDTPNFVANRIGAYAAVQCMQLTVKYGYDLQTGDYLSGPVQGRPKSASFKTADLVGLDIVGNVSRNVINSSTDDAEKRNYAIPGFVQELLDKGALGDKTGSGFYKKEIVDGKKVTLAYNYATKAYELINAPQFTSVESAMASANKYEAMAYGESKECEFYWELLKNTLRYSAALVPEIADDFREIDKALRAGFNWELGPFQMWDKIGIRRSVKRMRQEGDTVAQWVLDLLAGGRECFYDASGEHSGFIVLKHCDAVKKTEEASLRDIGDGVLCLEFHSKGNAIGERISDLMLESVDLLGSGDWNGMVIGNDGKNFSVGADLVTILKAVQEGDFDYLDKLIRGLQTATSALKYAPRPVVAAPFGVAYGGGCEVAMHCPGAVPFVETNLGLVETGVGLIPAGGGCAELLCRAMDRCYDDSKTSRFNAIKDVWKNIMSGRVNRSAYEAVENGYLDRSTYVEMRKEKLIDSAKAKVLSMAALNYHPPVEKKIRVMGDFGYAAIVYDLEFLRNSGAATEHDVAIGKKIANVICGGKLPYGTEVRPQQILDLEREAFLSLAGEEKTQERMIAMLTGGKALRN